MELAGVAVSGAASWLLCIAAARWGRRLGYVDEPDESGLKVHRDPAVPLGGVAILVGMVAGWLVAGGLMWGIVGWSALVVLLGLVDDRMNLSPAIRLVAEFLLAIGTIASGMVPVSPNSAISVLAGSAIIVVAINAVNLFDGLDGLAGSASLVAFLGVGILAAQRGLDPALGLLMAGALGGFLVLNRHPARVFLGDNGSYLVGFVLAVAILRVSPEGLGGQLWTTSLLLGVFLIDLIVTVARRRLSGSPVLSGDRAHLYDRLRERGVPLWGVVGLAVGVQGSLVTVSVIVESLTGF